MRLTSTLLFCAVALSAMLWSVTARANTLLPGAPTVTFLAPGDYKWSYDIFLDGSSTGSEINLTDDPSKPPIFTFYDISGYISGTEKVVGLDGTAWAASQQLSGLTPDNTAPADNPLLLNVSITMSGGSASVGPAPSAVKVATVTFESHHNVKSKKSNLQYAGHDFDDTQQYQANLGKVIGPAIPEPAFYQLSGLLGFGGLGLLRLRKKA